MIWVLLLAAILGWLVIGHRRKVRKLPPGPTSLPLLGNIHQIIYHVWRKKGIVPAFDYFRKTYGDIFTLWFGPIPHVSITDFETSHEVFVKNGNKYKDRFLPPIFEHVSEGLGLITANGSNWAEMRRFTLLTFRNMGVGRNIMEERIMSELNMRCSELDAAAVDGMTVVPSNDFFELTVGSVIFTLLAGKRFDDSNKGELIKLNELMSTAAEVFTIFDLSVPVWFLQKFFPRRYELSVKAQKDSLDYISRESMTRYEDWKAGKHIVDPENPADFVDAFLAKMEQENKNGVSTEYTKESMKHVLMDLWLAGRDTTAMSLVSGFNQLVNNPTVLDKVRKELRKITNGGSRPLSLKDRSETHYFNATISEIQRHASILNVNFWRVTNETTVVKGYELDAGTVIAAQVSALHCNDRMFKNPELFYPERFLENGALSSQTIPFGIGKRSCIGENIAKSEMYLMFGNLILRYDIRAHGTLPSTANFTPYTVEKHPDKSAKLEFRKF